MFDTELVVKRCPYCGSKAKLSIKESQLRITFKEYKLSCPKCGTAYIIELDPAHPTYTIGLKALVTSWNNIQKDVAIRVSRAIDWHNVKVDTPVLVSNDGEKWYKKHFSKYEHGHIFCFIGECTSWTQPETASLTEFKYGKLVNKGE